jgi:hypothetical protein
MTILRWLGVRLLVVAAVVGLGRQIAYGLAPNRPLADRFAGEAGGPAATWILLVALILLGLAAASGIVLVSVGVRERRALEVGAWANVTPRLRLTAMLRDAAGIGLAATAVFAVLEGRIHARAGMSMSPVECLTSPMHRNAIVVVASLAALAALVLELVRFTLDALRRRVARLLSSRERIRAARTLLRPCLDRHRPEQILCWSLRGRPPPASSVH